MKGQKRVPVQKKRRFAVDARVRVKRPGVNGVVTQVDDEQTVLGEYWHSIKTVHGERREPGCNLELIPDPVTNADRRATTLLNAVHFHGDNSRLNINSADNSTNVVSSSEIRLFVELHEKAMSITEEASREEIIRRIDEMEKAHKSGGFLQAYQNFVASAANHMTLFAPLLPALAQFLSGHS